MTAFTAQKMTMMRLFVVQVMITNKQTTHGATQFSVNEQTNTIFNVTILGHQFHQFVMEAQRKCFFRIFSFSLCFVLTIISAVQFNVRLASLPNQG